MFEAEWNLNTFGLFYLQPFAENSTRTSFRRASPKLRDVGYSVPGRMRCLVLLCYKRALPVISCLRMQHGHRGSRLARATEMRVRRLEIELAV